MSGGGVGAVSLEELPVEVEEEALARGEGGFGMGQERFAEERFRDRQCNPAALAAARNALYGATVPAAGAVNVELVP